MTKQRKIKKLQLSEWEWDVLCLALDAKLVAWDEREPHAFGNEHLRELIKKVWELRK